MSHQGKAIDYVLGGLTPDARANVATERLFNRELDTEIVEIEQVLAGLPESSLTAPKVPNLLPRLEAAIHRSNLELAGLPIEEFVDGNWQSQDDWIDFKPLWNEDTILIRCKPGGVSEVHDQPADKDEHIIILAGDLHMGERVFQTGAYFRVPAGRQHPRMWSEGGCILFTQYLS
jgi:ChrR Cupin-like domain